ncbi:hypothetical protein [Solimonas variicoloris]|uniref:hypothetical protein n=1 Tax=Solimonas variicoloris TaxID=254408 RepID=UPI00037E1B34|nr:hypothetical protein [Solimonas variicoloris]
MKSLCKLMVVAAAASAWLGPVVVHAAGDEALAPWFERVPGPPKTTAEAAARMRIEDQRATLDGTAFAAFQRQYDTRKQAIEARMQAAAAEGQVAAQGMHQDLNAAAGEDVTSEAFQEKFEKMSDAEKMALAMKMNSQMQKSMGSSYAGGANFAGQEPPAVQAATRAYLNYQQQVVAQAQDAVANAQLIAGLERAHRELDQRLSREAAACVASGDAAQALPCLRAKTAACWDQHAALGAQQLTQLQGTYQQQLARSRKAAAEADRVLAPAQYGGAARSYTGRSQLYGYQSQILGEVDGLAKLSQAAWQYGGGWVAGKGAARGEAVYVAGGEASCGYETRFGRAGSSGRSGSSRPSTPATQATKSVQDGAQKVLNWLGR